jgi:type IV pilus assembly protein PilC
MPNKTKKIQYEFRALNPQGNLIEGEKYAYDEFELQSELKNEGLNLLFADPVSTFSFAGISAKVSKIGTVSAHEKIIISRNLASMMGAGLSLSRSLLILARQTKNPKTQQILADVNERIKKGGTLSSALREYPKTFSQLMTSMVEAGEESGDLVGSLNTVADQMEKTYLLKKKVRGAMVYPSVIMFAMLIIGVFMLVYIVPTLTKTFIELGIELPATTKAIIDASDFVQNNLTVSLTGLIVIVLALIGILKTEPGKRGFDWSLLHLPLISPLVKEINSARTTRTLSSLLSAGVPFVRALEITGEVVQNTYFKEVINKAEKSIQLGLPISKVFREAENLYPIFVSEMMSVGEETGELGGMLLKVADFYEQEVDQKTKNMSTIVEPFLMILVGALVGFFAFSMITPMYTLVEQI